MKSITYIEEALKNLDEQIQTILMDNTLDMTGKNEFMLPILQQKRVLDQTLEDLKYLKANPPSNAGACTMHEHRND